MSKTSFPQNKLYRVPESDIPAINKKIEQLYVDRIQPFVPNVTDELKEHILETQKIIYLIDHYGEYNKDIDPVVVDALFDQLSKAVEDLNIEKDVCAKIIKDLRDYASIETETRYGKKLSDFDLEYFYLKKSCDVRFQRLLIQCLNKQQPESSKRELVGEILDEMIDDIDDLEEDKLLMCNGNRVLEDLRSGNVQDLKQFISLAKSYSNMYPKQSNKIVTEITKLMEESA